MANLPRKMQPENRSGGQPELGSERRLISSLDEIWTTMDIIGFFVDGLLTDSPPNYRILGYRRGKHVWSLRALVEYVPTRELRMYAMDRATRTPYRIA